MASRLVPQSTAFSLTSRRTKRERVVDGDHRAWIATLPCLVSGREGETQCAHISFAAPNLGKAGRGKGQREEDRWCVPLSQSEHARQHDMGHEVSYWQTVGIDPCIVALALWGCTGDTETAMMILQNARN